MMDQGHVFIEWTNGISSFNSREKLLKYKKYYTRVFCIRSFRPMSCFELLCLIFSKEISRLLISTGLLKEGHGLSG